MLPSIFTKTFADRDLESAVRTAAEIGYEGVEIMAREPHLPADTSLERAEEIETVLDALDLSVPCLATYTGGYSSLSERDCEAELETFEKYLELSTVLGVDLLRHGAGGPSVRNATDEDFERAAAWLERAADLAAEYDRTIGLEIHSHTLTETVDSTLRLLEMIDRDNVGIIHDAGNMFIVDDAYGPASVERLGDAIVHVHVKDLSRIYDPALEDVFELETQRGDELFRRELLGQGNVDHGPLFDALIENGYDGHVTTEAVLERRHPETLARHELEMLQALIHQVTG